MAPDESCQGCGHQNDCRAASERLSSFRGASVVGRVFAAFVAPMVFFIAVLVVGDMSLRRILGSGKSVTLLVFITAATCTLGFAFAIRFVRGRLDRREPSERCGYDS